MPPLSQPTVLESFWGLPVPQRFQALTRPTARELFVTVLWLFQDSNFSCSHWLLLTLFSLPSSLLTGFFDQHCTMHVPVHSLSWLYALELASLVLLTPSSTLVGVSASLACHKFRLLFTYTLRRHDASDGITSVELFSSLVCRLTNSLH